AAVRARRDDAGRTRAARRGDPADRDRHRAGALLPLAGGGLPDRPGVQGAARRGVPVSGRRGAMKAAVYRRYGAPDVVAVEEVTTPRRGDGEILVRVHAATVGVVDSLARRGTPLYARVQFGPLRPRFLVLGCDFAGQVEDIGPAVTRFGAGQAVFGTI